MEVESAPGPNAGRSSKRAQVLSEAIRQFNEKGYHDTRLEDVAQTLGTTKTSVSYYFKSKEALLLEAYSATCDLADQEIERGARAGEGRARVVSFLRGFAEAHSEALLGRREPVAIISDLAGLKPEDREAISHRLNSYADALCNFLVSGQEDGSVQVRSPEATTFFILSLQQWTRRWLQSVAPDRHRFAIDQLAALVDRGLSPRDTPQPPSARPGSGMEAEHFIFDREARNKMKLEAFLRVGIRHFNLNGYRSLSVNDVTGELGVSRGVFYYHFADKDALLKGCADKSLDTIETAISLHREGSANALDRLHMALTSLFEGHLSDLNPLLRQGLFASLPPRDRSIVVARSNRIVASFAELVALGVADGSIAVQEIEGVEYLISGAVFAATRQRLAAFRLSDGAAPTIRIRPADYFECLTKGLSA